MNIITIKVSGFLMLATQKISTKTVSIQDIL